MEHAGGAKAPELELLDQLRRDPSEILDEHCVHRGGIRVHPAEVGVGGTHAPHDVDQDRDAEVPEKHIALHQSPSWY